METSGFWKKTLKKSAVLSPVDRISEVLFGLIMVLTFTGTISVTSSGKQEINSLLWAALCCNFAWGLVDAIMYLLDTLTERGHSLTLIGKIRKAANPSEIRETMEEEIQPLISGLLSESEIDGLAKRIMELPEPRGQKLLSYSDIMSAVQIFFLVFLCTFPVVIPFLWLDEVMLAMRLSNAIALIMLFACGLLLARYAGFRPYVTALSYVGIGVILVAITMLLGG